MKKLVSISFLLYAFSLAFLVSSSFAEIAVIKIHFREAAELIPAVEALLSTEGKAVADERTNSILIRDDPASLKRIRSALSELDRPGEQLRIRMRFQRAGGSAESGAGLSGQISGEGWSASAGRIRRRNGARLSLGARDRGQQQKIESFITVISGGSAYIRVGEKIPFTERWLNLCRRYAHVVETIGFKRIETGLEVRPVAAGDMVHIELVPRISDRQGEGGVIRFTEASTRLSVPRGRWIPFGGQSGRSNEVIRHLLGIGRSEKGYALQLSIMVER